MDMGLEKSKHIHLGVVDSSIEEVGYRYRRISIYKGHMDILCERYRDPNDPDPLYIDVSMQRVIRGIHEEVEHMQAALKEIDRSARFILSDG